jgi:DNA polymerase-3 subunit gamma/tau
MSYLAIARKYRPATFDEIVGQEHVTRTLENALATGRIHHAFLFTGARGVGKTTAARALSRALNCAEGPTAKPCGVCTSCLEVASGSSPDLVEIDGASNNSVDDIRELRETVHYAPNGRYRIYLIDEVHMLSKAAFNALLKTLEEPPPHVVFLFATTEPNKILDTILSRVQRFDFKRIPVPAVVERLQRICAEEGASIGEGGLRLIARAGEGSMRDAESLLDKVISFSTPGEPVTDAQVAETLGLIDHSLLYEMLGGLIEGDPARCLDAIESVYGYGHELSQFTSDLLELVRHATFVRLSQGARRHVDLPAEELARLDEATEGVEPETLTRLFTALLEVHDQVSRATRPRMVLEMAVARLATVRPVQPVTALVARLEGIEQRLRRGGSSAAPRPMRGGPGGGGRARRSPRSTSGPSHGGRQPSARTDPGPDSPPTPMASAAQGGQSASPPRSSGAVATAPTAPAMERAPAPAPASRPPRQGSQRRAAADDEPPPWDEAPASVHHAGDERDPHQERMERWAKASRALRELGAVELSEATPEWHHGKVLLQVPSGRRLAGARRWMPRDQVMALVRRAFPMADSIDLVPMPGTGTPEEQEQALRAELLADPAVSEILTALGATLDKVVSLRDDDTPQS